MNTITSLVDQARAYVSKMEPAVSGQEGHKQTIKVAIRLVKFGLSPSDVWTLLNEYNLRCVPPWSERELHHKLADAFKLAGSSMPFKSLSTTKRTVRQADPISATKNYLKGFEASEVDLWEASPIRPPDDYTMDGACLVSMLYDKGDQLNVVHDYTLDAKGKANPASSGIILPRNEMIRHLMKGKSQSKAGAWLRMNPVDGRGVSDANVKAHKYALIESDALPLDLQLSLFAKLPLPIAAILSSGGRSLHCWVKVDCTDADDYRTTTTKMLGILAKFGIDKKNSNASRLSRLPGVQRNIGAVGDGRQRILFLNPEPETRQRIL